MWLTNEYDGYGVEHAGETGNWVTAIYGFGWWRWGGGHCLVHPIDDHGMTLGLPFAAVQVSIDTCNLARIGRSWECPEESVRRWNEAIHLAIVEGGGRHTMPFPMPFVEGGNTRVGGEPVLRGHHCALHFVLWWGVLVMVGGLCRSWAVRLGLQITRDANPSHFGPLQHLCHSS
jgi:hypothetical protein